MGLLTDYFAASNDEAAAAVLNRVGGPTSQQRSIVRTATKKRGLFGKKPSASVVETVADARLTPFDTVELGGIDPIVQMATLEEILTGRTYGEVVGENRIVADADGGEQLIVVLSTALTVALSEATDTTLEDAAVRWSQTEEFWGAADRADLAEQLRELGALARRTIEGGNKIYCWLSV